MRFQAIACDYDGTLATHGHVGEEVIASLKALRQSGRKLLMVTGRRLEELFTVFPHATLFDRIVAENGALLYRPATSEEVVLAEPPLPEFIDVLQQRGVTPIDVGRVIVATWEPHETTVLSVIRDLGLGMQIILNKGAVMILPADVSKATGLHRALGELGLSAHNVASVGDAENDHALLAASECGVAVSNAVEALKLRADVVTTGDHGAGVAELIAQMLHDDLAAWTAKLPRHWLTLGKTAAGEPFAVAPSDAPFRVAADSVDGALPWLKAFLRELSEREYQWALASDLSLESLLQRGILPESGAYTPSLEDAEHSLKSPKVSAVLDCSPLQAPERQDFFREFHTRLADLIRTVGRPHWTLRLERGQIVAVHSAQGQTLSLDETEGTLFVPQSDIGDSASADNAVAFEATSAGLIFPAVRSRPRQRRSQESRT